MKSDSYSFEKQPGGRGNLRSLAVPALVAALICAGLTVVWVKKLRPSPQAEKKSEWVINWVDLTDFKKPEAPKTMERK